MAYIDTERDRICHACGSRDLTPCAARWQSPLLLWLRCGSCGAESEYRDHEAEARVNRVRQRPEPAPRPPKVDRSGGNPMLCPTCGGPMRPEAMAWNGRRVVMCADPYCHEAN